MKLCIVTPTGQRRELLDLCKRWVLHQTVQPDLWLIVTDTSEPTTGIDLPDFARHIDLSARELRLIETFDPSNRSLAIASGIVPTDHATIIMEDDDYYPRDYVERQLRAIYKLGEVVGDRIDHRYHIGTKQYFVRKKPIPNLGCMAFAPYFVRYLREWLCDPFSSRDFWCKFRCDFSTGALRYSIKGAGYSMPGRAGMTHDPNNKALLKWQTDTTSYGMLRKWLGSDADAYITLAEEWKCRHAQ